MPGNTLLQEVVRKAAGRRNRNGEGDHQPYPIPHMQNILTATPPGYPGRWVGGLGNQIRKNRHPASIWCFAGSLNRRNAKRIKKKRPHRFFYTRA
jgi:hypothetical protein